MKKLKTKRAARSAVLGTKKEFVISNKGLALMAAIESGLLPKVEGGWDNTKFNAFWDKYQTYLIEKLLQKN